jgi:Putative transposase DNA-binding domain
MALIQSAVPLRVGTAIDEETGEMVEAGPLIGWLLDLVADLSTDLMGRCWQADTFTTLHQGVDARGRKLPPTAAVIAQRLGWIPHARSGVYVPSRVVRLAQANVVPILKTLADRDRLIPHVIAALDEHGHLDAARLGEQCGDVSAAFVRNLARQLRRNGIGEVSSITKLQSVPSVPRLARLGAVDTQLAALDAADPAGLWLRLKLPIIAAPTGRADWRWYKLWCPIPPHLNGRDIRLWHLPTISMHRGAPLLRFTITEAVAAPDTANATAALGVDWSPASLGAATVVAESEGQLLTDACTHVYNDRGLGQRRARLQSECERLSAKIDRLTALAANAPEVTQARLQAKIAVLGQHRRALGTKRRRINRELVFDFAKTMTTMAVGSVVGVIAVEDLRDLECRGRGKINNNCAAQSARRQAYRALEHTAARAGLEVVMCPARGTSALCPSCDHELARPDGYHSATCPDCRINGADRDQIAGQNIAKRVLLAKNRVKRPKNKPKRITTVRHQPVTKTREKITVTPRQRRHKRTLHTTLARPPRTRPTLHAKRPCGTETSRPRPWEAPLRNPSPPLATHQCQQVTETDRR